MQNQATKKREGALVEYALYEQILVHLIFAALGALFTAASLFFGVRPFGVALAAALVSMLSLESAMLTAFGADTPPETKRALIAATGAGISVIVLGISLHMIVKSVKEIKKYTAEKTNNA